MGDLCAGKVVLHPGAELLCGGARRLWGPGPARLRRLPPLLRLPPVPLLRWGRLPQELGHKGEGDVGWLPELLLVAQELQLLSRPGGPHVEKPPLLLQLLPLLRRGEQAIRRVDEDDAVILQALAGVNGGEGQRALRPEGHGLDDAAQLPQTQEKLAQNGSLVGQGEENVQSGRVAVLILKVVPVAHVPHQPLNGGKAGQAGHLGVVGLQGLYLPHLPGLQPAALQQGLEDAPVPVRAVEQAGEHGLLDPQIQLVVEAEEQVPVPVVKSELQHVGDVPHQRAGEEEALPLAAGAGDAPLVQQGQKGQGAVVVAVEDGGGLRAVLRHLQEVVVLAVVVLQGDPTDGAALLVLRAHPLGAAVLVAADESVRPLHNGPGGAVVGLQLQYPCAGKDLLKLQQGLGPRGPEAVDALVLVPHHEEALRGQQAEDGVLNLGGVLGLVHADIGPPAAEVGQDVRVLAEDAAGENHLVVVVHASAAEQIVLVLEVHPGEVHPLHLVGVDLRFGKHHVLAVGDVGAGGLYQELAGEGGAGADQQIPDDAAQLPLIVQQGKGLRAPLPGVVSDHHGAQAVDGAEGEPPGLLLPEEAYKPGPHVPGGGHGVGHGENLLRRDAPAAEHVPQPGDQHSGLAASRHSQEQRGPLRQADRLLLLRVQGDGVLGPEFLVRHGISHHISAATKSAGAETLRPSGASPSSRRMLSPRARTVPFPRAPWPAAQ